SRERGFRGPWLEPFVGAGVGLDVPTPEPDVATSAPRLSDADRSCTAHLLQACTTVYARWRGLRHGRCGPRRPPAPAPRAGGISPGSTRPSSAARPSASDAPGAP